MPAESPEQPLLCQWCQLPPLPPIRWWDGKPQCADPHRCERRRRKKAHR